MQTLKRKLEHFNPALGAMRRGGHNPLCCHQYRARSPHTFVFFLSTLGECQMKGPALSSRLLKAFEDATRHLSQAMSLKQHEKAKLAL